MSKSIYRNDMPRNKKFKKLLKYLQEESEEDDSSIERMRENVGIILEDSKMQAISSDGQLANDNSQQFESQKTEKNETNKDLNQILNSDIQEQSIPKNSNKNSGSKNETQLDVEQKRSSKIPLLNLSGNKELIEDQNNSSYLSS